MIMRVNDPVEVMQELNRYMGELYRSDELINYYFTAIFVVVDTDSRSMEYVNAGHPAGVILSGGEVVYMEPTGPAVGLFDKLAIRKVKLAYEPGTDLFLYTDGLLDALEVSDCGMRELAESMSSKKSLELNPEELVESLLAEHGGDKQRDDICLVRAVLH
jgi:sigma-B regulation protein RsbU (phosphoserine phosphatase)